MAGTQVRAGIYCRISDDREGRGLGVKRQEADARALCEARGWTVAAVYVDNDQSAYSGRRRPAYERLVDAIEARTITAVVAWHPDRLHRSPRELERFIDVIETAKAKVATVQAGELDLGTASGRMTARVVGAVARHESEHKSERQKSKAAELAKAGKVGGGGPRPYGYETDRITIVKKEAKVIRDAATRILAGETLRGVAADLNRRGVPTVTGTPWTTTVLRRILTAPRTAGLREHQGATVADAVWPAIIDRATHEAVVALLTDPARRANRSPRRYLLAGLAHCALCDGRLVARPRADKRRCYVCASGPGFGGCGKIRSLSEGPRGLDYGIAHPDLPLRGIDQANPGAELLDIGLEEWVVAQVIAVLDTPALSTAATRRRARPDPAPTDVAALEGRLDELAAAWADGDIDRRSWLAARKRLDERLGAARRALAVSVVDDAAAPFRGREGALREAWPDLPFDARRAVVAAVVDRVAVGPGVRGRNWFDPGRVTITWRS